MNIAQGQLVVSAVGVFAPTIAAIKAMGAGRRAGQKVDTVHACLNEHIDATRAHHAMVPSNGKEEMGHLRSIEHELARNTEITKDVQHLVTPEE